jgi:hypothetical protein
MTTTDVTDEGLEVFLDEAEWWESGAGNPVRKYKGAYVTIFAAKFGSPGYFWGLQATAGDEAAGILGGEVRDRGEAKVDAFKHANEMWSDD